jgi:hypothetical protein
VQGNGVSQKGKNVKIRIASNRGLGSDTLVTNAETGEKINNVHSAIINCNATSAIVAELTFHVPEVDIVAFARLSNKSKQDLLTLTQIMSRIELEDKSKT